MAKVQIKSEKVTHFGGIFHVRELLRNCCNKFFIIVAAKRFYLLYRKGLAIPFFLYLNGISIPFKDEIESFVSLPSNAILSPSLYHLST
ncbi:MAG: hypothetical protein PUF55_01770, partial [Bacteroidales bacterium]|nr:hypothetical protein [Bacteroidales bacterium]